MRSVFAGLFMAAVVATPAYALGDLTAFSDLQQECAQAGGVSFGEGGRWANCQVTRGRWVSTIDFIDMYQAQYCLGGGEGKCQNQALTLYGNRAYTPIARVQVQRIDPAGTVYDDPLVIANEFGYILTVAAHLPDGSSDKSYYRWHTDHWTPIDARAWQVDLAKRLPEGVTAKRIDWPNADGMSVRASLSRSGEAAGVAEIELGVANERFALKKVSFAPVDR